MRTASKNFCLRSYERGACTLKTNLSITVMSLELQICLLYLNYTRFFAKLTTNSLTSLSNKRNKTLNMFLRFRQRKLSGGFCRITSERKLLLTLVSWVSKRRTFQLLDHCACTLRHGEDIEVKINNFISTFLPESREEI